ncbi:MAG: cation diffusion facilitator family transporter [Planctomycetaceae bacterium]
MAGSPSSNGNAFPEPVAPSRDTELRRQERARELLRVAWIGMALRTAVIVVELVGGLILGYAALFVDAFSSMFDVLASVGIVLAIHYAARPPDENHPFGHGRVEPLAGLQLGLLVCAAGLWLATQNLWGAMRSPAAGEVRHWAWCLPAGCAVILELSARLVRRIGLRQESTALMAEAYHYRIDAATSVIAAVGLLMASALPALGHLIDHLSAMLLAVVMISLGAAAAVHNYHQVLDRAPDSAHFEQVRTSTLRVSGVRGVEKVRIQHAGPDAHVDIDIEVDPQMNVADAHVITQHVRAAIQSDWPAVREVVVHVEPYFAGDH